MLNLPRFKQIQSKSPNQIQIFPTDSNLPNRWNRVKSAQINKQIIKHYQNLCKSSRIVLNPAETTNIYPNRNPTQSSKCDPLTQNASINESQFWIHKLHRICQLHKQLHIAQNSKIADSERFGNILIWFGEFDWSCLIFFYGFELFGWIWQISLNSMGFV